MIHTHIRVILFISSISYVQTYKLYRMIVQGMVIVIFEPSISYESTKEFYRLSHPELQGDICHLGVVNAFATELY